MPRVLVTNHTQPQGFYEHHVDLDSNEAVADEATFVKPGNPWSCICPNKRSGETHIPSGVSVIRISPTGRGSAWGGPLGGVQTVFGQPPHVHVRRRRACGGWRERPPGGCCGRWRWPGPVGVSDDFDMAWTTINSAPTSPRGTAGSAPHAGSREAAWRPPD